MSGAAPSDGGVGPPAAVVVRSPASITPPTVTDEALAALSPVHREMVRKLIGQEPSPGTGGREGAPDNESPDRRADGSVAGPPSICFAPGTDRGLMEALWDAAMVGHARRFGDDVFAAQAFQLDDRWPRSALTPSSRGLRQGDPITLTWGFVPDGTNVPGGTEGAGEPASPSNLLAWLRTNWGGTQGAPPDTQPWFPLFQGVFDRWGELTGVRYVYEPNDDGAAFPGSGGSAGTRPDIRIAGHRIDGGFGTLAYNYFPTSGGDMVLDSDDTFLTNTANDSLRLRNTVAHEHGHGLGIAHVCPIDRTKLMEPQLSTSFDGPQFDDTYSANRLYGDPLEDADGDNSRNDSAGTATDLGPLEFGAVSIPNLSIDDNSDDDYIRLELPAGSALLSVRVTPAGSTYPEGAEGESSCPAGTPFNALAVHDLAFDVLAPDGSTVLLTAAETGPGTEEAIVRAALPHGTGPYYLRIHGHDIDRAQLYGLTLSVEPQVIPEASVAGSSAPEAYGVLTFEVTLSPAPVATAEIDYATVAGTAQPGSDFTAVAGTLTFPQGTTTRTVEVPLVDDPSDEDDETFDLLLSNPRLATLATASATGTIADDDPPPVLSLAPASVTEAAFGTALPATLSAPSSRTVTATVAVAAEGTTATAETEFRLVTTSLAFAPNETTKSVVIQLVGDALDEADETVVVALGSPVNATLGTAEAALTIIDDDPSPALSLTAADTDEPGGAAVFTFTLETASGRPVALDFSTAGGTAAAGDDYVPPAGTLVIETGATTATVEVATVDDVEPETNETIVLGLTGGSGFAAADPPHTAVATIRDDDAADLLASTVAAAVADNGLELTLLWSAVPGRRYLIERTRDLVLWEPEPSAPLGEVVADSAEAEVAVPMSPGETRVYFRVTDPDRAGVP